MLLTSSAKRLAALILVVAAAMVAPQPAAAGPAPNTRQVAAGVCSGNNNCAYITDSGGNVIPAATNNGTFTQCGSGYFCMWTSPNLGGTLYKLYNCGSYNLFYWNATGTVYNHQYGNPAPTVYFYNASTGTGVPANTTVNAFNYLPWDDVNVC
ncbi:hypothetical protein [Catellatospora paridis]|uniref:hypothetical protein n=1 Tax=Catellatospora paridis TaxID=1617086 RepID=UPI0012D3B3AA|nr:hypothetical protein [Catellatospora paridis]